MAVCPKCNGRGRQACNECYGSGKVENNGNEISGLAITAKDRRSGRALSVAGRVGCDELKKPAFVALDCFTHLRLEVPLLIDADDPAEAARDMI